MQNVCKERYRTTTDLAPVELCYRNDMTRTGANFGERLHGSTDQFRQDLEHGQRNTLREQGLLKIPVPPPAVVEPADVLEGYGKPLRPSVDPPQSEKWATSVAMSEGQPETEVDERRPALQYLYPPIHNAELATWSHALLDLDTRDDAPLPPTRGEEGGLDDLDLAGEPDDEAEREETELPVLSYSEMSMDAALVTSGAAHSLQLRAPSHWYPENEVENALLLASPLPLPMPYPQDEAVLPSRPLSMFALRECLYYHLEHGTTESLLALLVSEGRLKEACAYVFEQQVSTRAFVDILAQHCLAHNSFHELQKVILDYDPSLKTVDAYVEILKEFLRSRRVLDLLYSYQVFTKDYVNAGLLAIQLFVSSKTWDARIGHLQNAQAHLQMALQVLRSEKAADERDREPGHARPPRDERDDHWGKDGREADLRRTLEAVELQMEVSEVLPKEMPWNLSLFSKLEDAQREVAERLLVGEQYDLAQRVIEFLDLPAVEIYVRASNEMTTLLARGNAPISPVLHFLSCAVRRLAQAEADSLVSNVLNIWILEKTAVKEDPGAALQLIKFIQDERCRMDAYVLLGSLGNAFQIAQRLGSLQDILHIRSCAQQVGDTGLMAQINTFLAYNAPRTLNGKKQL